MSKQQRKYKKGCLGPSCFDWFVKCKTHGLKEPRGWCPSCVIRDQNNADVHDRLEALKAEHARQDAYGTFPQTFSRELLAIRLVR